MTTNIVTVDGPAASGKSSVSRELARRMKWKWVSTGAFYRGLAYVAMKEGIKANATDRLVALARSNVWLVRMDDDQTRVLWQDQDVTAEILSEDNGSRASVVSQVPEVRQALLQNQRDCAKGVAGLVAEGRDCGTVVFPDALLKIFLTASQEERASRRAREKGQSVEKIQAQQQVRDEADTSRAAAPLQVPPNARVVDSNGLELNQVVDRIEQWVREALR